MRVRCLKGALTYSPEAPPATAAAASRISMPLFREDDVCDPLRRVFPRLRRLPRAVIVTVPADDARAIAHTTTSSQLVPANPGGLPPAIDAEDRRARCLLPASGTGPGPVPGRLARDWGAGALVTAASLSRADSF